MLQSRGLPKVMAPGKGDMRSKTGFHWVAPRTAIPPFYGTIRSIGGGR